MPFEMVRNDITQMDVDAIVNAANRSLLGGGGVDGAIHRAAGPELMEECRNLGGCETGEAKITKGYRLPARYVIHTVGPVWHGGGNGERELLFSCYRRSLEVAAENGCESVAFPMISAGAYGYPKDQALAVAVEAITAFLLEHEMTVYLVVFGREDFLTGKKLFRDIQEYIDDVYAEERIHRRREAAREQFWRENEKAALDLDMAISQAAREDACFGAAPEELHEALPCADMPDWDEMLRQTDEGFSQRLIRLIDERGWTDAQCYKRANVSRKLFSKIRSNPGYQPSKPTALAFAVALELPLEEAVDLLKAAGYSLTRSNPFDIVLEYCLSHRIYDIWEINEVLFQYDMPLLGSSMD